MTYAELACASNYSFLRGASQPETLILRALKLGYSGLGLCDRNSVAGVVRALGALEDFCEDEKLSKRAKNFKFIVGARLVFADGAPDIIAYPRNRAGWGRLCRLLTVGKRRAKKGECLLNFEDLLTDAGDLLLILLPPPPPRECESFLARAKNKCAGLWLGVAMPRGGADRRRLQALREMALRQGVKSLAQNDVLYACPEDRPLQDVLTCVREHVTLAQAGRRLESNAERHLKAPGEMARLFADAPEAIEETQNFLARVKFHLRDLAYEYPDEPVPQGWTPQVWLEELVHRALPLRYPEGAPQKVSDLLAHELALIAELDYAPYFLTIHDIVSFAREKGILCQGRGSAANSAVCYVLGITAVDPAVNDLLFARFISSERREPPDIDVDFEHERREEVIQHIYAKYGRARAGLAAEVIRYRSRSALRDVAKVFDLSEDMIGALSSLQWGGHGSPRLGGAEVAKAGLDPDNPVIAQVLFFAQKTLGFPRHLSQHVGGFVLTRGRLDEICPIGNAAMAERTFLEWDKDDIATLGLMKVDVLALGMLTCIRKAFDLLAAHENLRIGLADVPREDSAVYDMLCRGDSVGVFQVESRAQMNMLPHLRPRAFYDLVIEVAIVRPGPIQGDMVHPYLRRRAGLEPVSYPSPAPGRGDANELRSVLGKTLGVPLFQEQAMRLAMVAAEFSEAEANRLRRAMATFRHLGEIGQFESLMVERMVSRGYERAFAQRCFEQIKGFGSYGFPESHAASFAILVYISAWLKCRHPQVFACALLNAQPMGFYAPAQIVRDAREHGVEIRPVDVNASQWDNTLERGDAGLALRIGFRQISGLREDEIEKLVAARGQGFDTLESCAARTALSSRALKLLADADAFRSCRAMTFEPRERFDRRAALWAARRLPGEKTLPLFAAAGVEELAQEPDPLLPALGIGEQVVADYQSLRLTLNAHPMQLLRPLFSREKYSSARALAGCPDGAWRKAAGLVLIRQRPGDGKMVFVTLEDETGVINVAVYARLFEQFRRETMAARLMAVEGRVQKSWAGVVHLLARRIYDRSDELSRLAEGLHGRAERAHHPRNVRVIPKSRDFH
ncbi:error-prone DNA polymerase [Rhodoblastus sphagnicola]|uniref:Error-prone DNA polymerase n=1 Tax=Rhodoblastus sphagnicola TaxID=333368 RepID=A0A2S6N324_9HYPH|nr:error-prone DNA polymerase [Rhodoblastus sphagnicola]MBB4199107.1 error-prone DNA polymerase [Rhodoblastus sphagnicola]PPQ28996.1 error-prone DNA polymerase [Rhodoblastus sphagnicola]